MIGGWWSTRSVLTAVSTVAIAIALLLRPLPHVAAEAATPVASPLPGGPAGTLPPPWLEFGPDGTLIARVIVEAKCPPLFVDGLDAAMAPRAAHSDAFPVVACEAIIPFGAESATILGQDLPLPDGPPSRIAVIGDTGCRVNAWEGKYQACNDPNAWPFAAVARSIAAWEPDLIVHVGDYLYRESACPAGMTGCEGNPYGDNWATWDADFFTPAASLLGAAPWLYMRGNHETCDRNPEGWFVFLDPHPYQVACQRFTEPYVAVLSGLSFAVIDSAEAADTKVASDEEAQYARQFDLLAAISPPGSWLVTHRPVWGILRGNDGDFEAENASYEAATAGSLKADYALVLSGHIHLAETIAFDELSERPPQIVSGNAGTALDDAPTASPTAGQLGDPTVAESETLAAFGFLTLEPAGDDWIATQRNVDGDPVLGCILDLPAMSCGPPELED